MKRVLDEHNLLGTMEKLEKHNLKKPYGLPTHLQGLCIFMQPHKSLKFCKGQ